jgi:hypothetical protein
MKQAKNVSLYDGQENPSRLILRAQKKKLAKTEEHQIQISKYLKRD